MDTGDVAWHYVRRELDALKTAATAPCKRAEQHGLACPRHILKKDMTSADITYGNQSDLLLFAHNGLRTGFD